ncbi:MAG: sulfite exporter TauE/SafE family protein, partial [Candidatus Rokuibacteriota bacterium]
MTLETAVYSGLVLLLAYWVRGMAGFGSGLIAVPLLTLAWPVTVVVPLVVALDYIGSASQGIRNV